MPGNTFPEEYQPIGHDDRREAIHSYTTPHTDMSAVSGEEEKNSKEIRKPFDVSYSRGKISFARKKQQNVGRAHGGSIHEHLTVQMKARHHFE